MSSLVECSEEYLKGKVGCGYLRRCRTDSKLLVVK